MARFFETFEVVESTGSWTAGPYGIDTLGSGFTSIVTEACSPAARPTPPDYDIGHSVHPFAIIGNLITPTICEPDDVRPQVVEFMAGATEYRVTQTMWFGNDDTEDATLYLKHGDITEVPRAADLAGTLAAVLAKAYEKTPHIQPVIHLGLYAAQALQFALQNLKLPYVVPPAYPVDAVAVTGHVRVRLSPITTADAVRRQDNRHEYESTRFGAIEFDPVQAVRAADSA
jgi:hypothetical protein